MLTKALAFPLALCVPAISLASQEKPAKLQRILEFGIRRSPSATLERTIRSLRAELLRTNKAIPIEVLKLLSFRSEFLPLRADR